MRKLFAFVFCLSLLIFVVSCNRSNVQEEQSTATNEQTAPAEQRSDVMITSEVATKLADDESLDDTDIEVETNNGTVTLSGTVPSETLKTHAEQLARGVEGVQNVNSQITVQPGTMADKETETQEKTDIGQEAEQRGEKIAKEAEKFGEQVKEESADALITTQVKAALALDKDIQAMEIDVDTENGTVTLRGTVDSKEREDKAIELARGVRGVKAVQSYLKVEG